MAPPLYPLRFEPIFKTMLWGGTRLRPFLSRPPSEEPTGEAWLLSDVDGSQSRVSHGPLAGKTLRELMTDYSSDLLGDAKPINGRFPVLLKFIDAKQELSVQVHPNDEQARLKNPTAAGKTEAWVILDANPATSRIYAGFNDGVTAESFRAALAAGTVPGTLHQFTPERGDCVFLPAGTVHAIGADILLFEVQQTSDITYRLYDWDRIDSKTGKPRDLHVEDGLACANFEKGPCPPVEIEHVGEWTNTFHHLVDCDHFRLIQDRITGRRAIARGLNRCQILTVVEGSGTIDGEPVALGETVSPSGHRHEERDRN